MSRSHGAPDTLHLHLEKLKEGETACVGDLTKAIKLRKCKALTNFKKHSGDKKNCFFPVALETFDRFQWTTENNNPSMNHACPFVRLTSAKSLSFFSSSVKLL